ncbi:hypothetical protein RJ640_010809 [Escallonia rubra]|uniref:Serpin domain-containing protein n=1 Tax=Escallonia rubra TaxID=112253 RepID=A0AA88RDX7_9ASTE|nr:hypothetical protein RJ640_010809 [Escallonia rubra]
MNSCVWIANKHLLTEVAKGDDKNLVVSPLSFNAVLNMVAAGSTGRTLEQILGFFGLTNVDQINSISSEMMAVASPSTDSSGGPVLSCLNAAWADQRFPLKPSYRDLLRHIYAGEAKNVEFATQANQVMKEVNAWAEAASQGHIKNILSSLTKDTVLLLANALYFKENSIPYGSFEGFKLLKIAYKSGEDCRQFSMYILLPNEIDGLKSLLQRVDSDPGFLHQRFDLRLKFLAEFWVPKFKFSNSIEASSILRDLGLELPFMHNCKDLTEMVHNSHGLPFNISNIIQKASIEIDETGTVAAAATVGCICISAGREGGGGHSFVADHPFMFTIKEETSGLVFFTGAVLDPRSH